jgi:hypothetical protein
MTDSSHIACVEPGELAVPVYGTIEEVDIGKVTIVPFAELLLPSIGTVRLNFAQTSPNR